MKDFYIHSDNFIQYSDIPSIPVIEGNVIDPEYSIFIPTYKRIDTLAATIESAINQMGQLNYEILVISNDPEADKNEVYNMIREYRCEKIYYYVNSQNIGVCGNWNRGIELSRGSYVTMVHDDDILSPWFLLSINKAVKELDYPSIIGVSHIVFNSKNMPIFVEPGKLQYRKVTKRSFFFGKYINIAGMTVNRKLMLSIGGYRDEYLPNEDSILIYQALLFGSVYNIESVLAGYRKEINDSMTVKTITNVVVNTEFTRRTIAAHESFARIWLKLFDREYLYHYIQSVNSYWGHSLNYIELFQKLNLDCSSISGIKYSVMKVLLHVFRKG